MKLGKREYNVQCAQCVEAVPPRATRRFRECRVEPRPSVGDPFQHQHGIARSPHPAKRGKMITDLHTTSDCGAKLPPIAFTTTHEGLSGTHGRVLFRFKRQCCVVWLP